MWKRFKPPWLALGAGALLVALSVSSAFGANPWGEEGQNPGQQVSEFVHSLFSGDQEDENQDETTDEDTSDEDTTDEDALDGEWANHGECVAATATGDETGGPNDTHGWPVSDAARYTCWGEESQAEDTDTEDTEAETHGNSASAHDKTHGRGHGGGH